MTFVTSTRRVELCSLLTFFELSSWRARRREPWVKATWSQVPATTHYRLRTGCRTKVCLTISYGANFQCFWEHSKDGNGIGGRYAIPQWKGYAHATLLSKSSSTCQHTYTCSFTESIPKWPTSARIILSLSVLQLPTTAKNQNVFQV